MKKITTIIISLMVLILTIGSKTNNIDYNDNKSELKDIDNWNYVYSIALIRNPHNIATRYADVVMKYSKQYHINPRIKARLNYNESHYDYNAVSSKGAKGHSQIMPLSWMHLLYEIAKTDKSHF